MVLMNDHELLLCTILVEDEFKAALGCCTTEVMRLMFDAFGLFQGLTRAHCGLLVVLFVTEISADMILKENKRVRKDS